MNHLVLLVLLSIVLPALARAQTMVAGRLVGSDGRAMKLAHVHIKKFAMQRMASSSAA